MLPDVIDRLGPGSEQAVQFCQVRDLRGAVLGQLGQELAPDSPEESLFIFSSNKFSLHFRRSGPSRTRPRRWREGPVALLGGLAVLVSEAGGDLLSGGACGAGGGDELVLAEVE